MGFYVELIEQNAKLLESDLDEAYKILCALNDRNDLKTGGRWPREEKDGPHNGIWFSWMDWNYPETCENAVAIFQQIGFDVYAEDDGSIILTYYNDKTGAQHIFLNSLSSLWKSRFDGENPYFTWRGEDGSMWRYEYVDGETIILNPKIEWVEQ